MSEKIKEWNNNDEYTLFENDGEKDYSKLDY